MPDYPELFHPFTRYFRDQTEQAQRIRDMIDTPRNSALHQLIEEHQAVGQRSREMIEAFVGPSKFSSDILGSVNAIIGTRLDTHLNPVGAILGTAIMSDPSPWRPLHDSSALQQKLRENEGELTRLRSEVTGKRRELDEQQVDAAQKDRAIAELQAKLQELDQKQRLAHLLARVEPTAQERLLESEEFSLRFNHDEPCDAFVMSVDIRRSTELMLKARTPKLFAEFIVGLTRILRDIVLANHGIFDKFTGDGILAFFPTFYAGPDAGLWLLKAAAEAHAAFAMHYERHRHCFSTVLLDVGIGIGVDYGPAQIVQMGAEFTVVGQPVVYACRMAGARPGETLVNQPAYECLQAHHSVVCDFTTVELLVKNEGPTLAYAARLNGRPCSPKLPEWYSPVSLES